jgi:aldose 1-epimerase
MPAPAPSGRQSLLSYGDQQAVVVEVGGGLRSYTVKGVDVIDGYAESEVCTGARGHPLIPWPNRLDGGHYAFDGTTRQFAINEISAGNAIHGLTSWVSWTRVGSGTDHVTMANTLHPQPGWDWTIDLTITYALGPDGLRVTTTAVNRSQTHCPFGVGFHPYFRPPSGRVENVVLGLPASSYDVVNDRNIPVARADVDDTLWDFRQPRRIGELAINLGYTDIQRDADGVATFTAAEPGTDWHVAVRFERGWDWAVVYTGDTLESGARQSVAIEPMTGPANLMQTGDHRLVLEPHQPWEASWSIVPGWL